MSSTFLVTRAEYRDLAVDDEDYEYQNTKRPALNAGAKKNHEKTYPPVRILISL
jgi:hypothetical protein